MAERTSVLTHSRPPSVDKAMDECFIACNMTDLQTAFRGLVTLISRPRCENEDDDDVRDSVVALIRLTHETMRRRSGLAVTALQALSTAIQRERAPGTI